MDVLSNMTKEEVSEIIAERTDPRSNDNLITNLLGTTPPSITDFYALKVALQGMASSIPSAFGADIHEPHAEKVKPAAEELIKLVRAVQDMEDAMVEMYFQMAHCDCEACDMAKQQLAAAHGNN